MKGTGFILHINKKACNDHIAFGPWEAHGHPAELRAALSADGGGSLSIGGISVVAVAHAPRIHQPHSLRVHLEDRTHPQDAPRRRWRKDCSPEDAG